MLCICKCIHYLTEEMCCIQESSPFSFTDCSYPSSFYSQDPVWSRPTFLFLRTYCVGLLSSMEWSITKVSVAKHSGTPVFKVSNFLTVWTDVLVKYFRCGTIPVSEGGLDLLCEITPAYMCLHSWHNCPSDLSVITMYNMHQPCVFHLWGTLQLKITWETHSSLS